MGEAWGEGSGRPLPAAREGLTGARRRPLGARTRSLTIATQNEVIPLSAGLLSSHYSVWRISLKEALKIPVGRSRVLQCCCRQTAGFTLAPCAF